MIHIQPIYHIYTIIDELTNKPIQTIEETIDRIFEKYKYVKHNRIEPTLEKEIGPAGFTDLEDHNNIRNVASLARFNNYKFLDDDPSTTF